MYIKKINIENKELILFKNKTEGDIYVEFNSLINYLGFKKSQIKLSLKKLNELNLLINYNNLKLFPLNKNKIFNELIKNFKSEEQKNLILLNKKGLYTKCKKEMKAFLPDVLIEALVENKITEYFNKLEDKNYFNNYNILNNNLYSIKSVDKIDLNKKILKITKIRNNKKTIKEITYLKVSKDIEIMLEKNKNKKIKLQLNKLKTIKDNLLKENDVQKNEIKKNEGVYDYFIDCRYLYSYNRALKAVYTDKLALDPKYKSWKDNLIKNVKKTAYFKYIINDKIFNFIKKNKVDFFLKIYIYISEESKEKEWLPDADNYIKPFQDVLVKSLGIDDKYFKIKNFEFVEVNCYEKQGYYFGLRKTEE